MKKQTLKEFLENTKIYYKENTTPLFKRDIPIKLKLEFYDFLKLNYGIAYANYNLKKDLNINLKELKKLNKEVLK